MAKKSNVLIIAGVAAVVVLVAVYLYPVSSESEGVLSISELLKNPLHDAEVRTYGEVSLLGELFCPCFELASGGETVEVWYNLMVEDDGTERPPVSVDLIENGDWVIVTGELKTAGEHKNLNDFWAEEIVLSSSDGTPLNEAESLEIALEFVRNSPTFQFDGMQGTLNHTETRYPRCPYCWQFVFAFESNHAGSSDRAGQQLDQMITSHTAIISLEKGKVVYAVMDEEWDMINQASRCFIIHSMVASLSSLTDVTSYSALLMVESFSSIILPSYVHR